MIVKRAVWALPFALLAGLANVFLNRAPALQIGSVVISAGMLSLAVLLLRTFLNWQFELGNYRNRVFTAANRSFYNYAILLFVLLVVLGALLSLGNGPERHVTLVLRLTALLFYLLIVLRRGQIFASACGPFTTFLYLCGLELIPTGVLVATAVLL